MPRNIPDRFKLGQRPPVWPPQADLTVIRADITALEAVDVTLDGRLDVVEADIVALEAADVALDSRLDALEVTPTYTNYAGSLAWVGSGGNPAIGNGVIEAKYIAYGKMIHYYGKILMGSTTTFGVGTWSISLPVAKAASSNTPVGTAWLRDATGNDFHAFCYSAATNEFLMRGHTDGANTAVGVTTPFTWANTDWFSWSLMYEAA